MIKLPQYFSNLRVVRLLLILVVLFACRKNDSFKDEIFRSFNLRAKKAFIENFESYDLYPMNDREKCILKEGIMNYLDSMNSSKLLVLDSFYIRTYDFKDLGSIFTFISKNDIFYFLYWPRFYSYASNEFYVYKDSIGEPKKSEFSIALINNATVDEFLAAEVFIDAEPRKQYERGVQVLLEVFPALSDFARFDDFENWLKVQPEPNREIINRVLSPILKRPQQITGERDYLVSKIEYIGYVFYDFHMIDEATPNVELDIYFMPFLESYGFQYQTDKSKFSGCFKNMQP